MANLLGIPLLPFWILGVPFLVAIVSWLRLPSRGDLVHHDRRAQRRDETPRTAATSST